MAEPEDDKATAWNRDHRAVSGETNYTTMATWVTNAWEARVWSRLEADGTRHFPHALHFKSSGEAMYAAEKMLQDSSAAHDCDERHCHPWRKVVSGPA